MDSKSKSCGVESAGERERKGGRGEENGINRNRQIDTCIPLRESNRWRRAREDNADRAGGRRRGDAERRRRERKEEDELRGRFVEMPKETRHSYKCSDLFSLRHN